MAIKSMKDAFSLVGKNAIVTGGAKGIGLGISTAFAQQGANIGIFARDSAAADAVVAEFEKEYSGKFAYYQTDISDMASCKKSVDSFVKDFGSVDVLVNNAGIATGGGLLTLDDEISSWFECFNVDLHGGVRMCYHVGKYMRDSGNGGHIINITSNAGEIVNEPLLTSYAAAKAAFNHFTRCFAAEVAPYKMRVNAIAPGFTMSNFTKGIPEGAMEAMCETIPIGRFADAIEIGALAVYLASDASDIVTGAVFTADGGFAIQH